MTLALNVSGFKSSWRQFRMIEVLGGPPFRFPPLDPSFPPPPSRHSSGGSSRVVNPALLSSRTLAFVCSPF